MSCPNSDSSQRPHTEPKQKPLLTQEGAVCCASPALAATGRVFGFHLGPGAMVNICPGPTGGLDAPRRLSWVR